MLPSNTAENTKPMTQDAQLPALERAAHAIINSTGMLVTAGAGMSCDSGIPDYRGPGGLWRKHPGVDIEYSVLSERGMYFTDPRRAWGFLGWSIQRYLAAQPHAGYVALRQMGARLRDGFRVFTSNVDQMFVRSGMSSEDVVECHGSMFKLQCLDSACTREAFVDVSQICVDPESLQWIGEVPRCDCGAVLRPNALLFNDGPNWRGAAYHAKERVLREWVGTTERLVVLEIGSGGGVPTVRMFGEELAAKHHGVFIRLNLRSPWVSNSEGIAIEGHAEPMLVALERMTRAGSR